MGLIGGYEMQQMSGTPSCPACSSPDVMRARVAYEQQTNVHRLSTGTVGIGTGGIGLASSSTSGRSQSLAALKLAPPRADFVLIQTSLIVCGVLASFLAFGIGAAITKNPIGALVAMVLVIGVVVVMWRQVGQRRKEYPAIAAAYERTWVCARCGVTGDHSEFIQQSPT